MTMEKSGSVVLTEDDLKQYNEGVVSKRVSDTWGLAFNGLKDIIDRGMYTKVGSHQVDGKLNEQTKDSE